ncbi:MAG: pacearchaeosortase [Nanoarchaeota archaeon]|nr:pacearchaeosortase [Nanoarchaeota archaeon]
METKQAGFLILRYFILVVLGVGLYFDLFYLIFTPLTVYPVYWISSLIFENAHLIGGNLIFFSGVYAEIIPACVAGAAYFLLLILNLTTQMEIKKRLKNVAFLFIAFLIFNMVRIVIFSGLLVSGSQYFDEAHFLVWYLGSTFLVVALWFVSVWLFKIKEIPFYSDFRELFRDVRRGK